MSPTSPAVGQPRHTLIPVFAACAGIGLQAGVNMPLVPLALEQQGHDRLTIGIVSAVWAIGMLSFGTRIPALAARFGAVPAIVGAVALGALINVGFTVTSSLAVWVVLNFLHGVIGGVPWVISEIWMNVVVEEKRRGRVMALYSAMVALGMALGPLVLQAVGVYGPLPFLTGAALSLLVAAPVLPYWRSAPRIRVDEASGFVAVIVVAPLALFGAFACGLGEQVAFSFLPVYAVGAGVPAETGALWLSAFVIGNVVLQWPIGWLADHVDRRVVLAGCALASMLLVVVLSAVSAQSLAIIAVIALWGGLSFAIYPVGLALLGQRIAGGDIARANTAYSMLYILGGLVGRPLAGGAMDAFGGAGLGGTLAVFYSIAGAAALLAFHRRR
ncbi:MAG: MFS transporter [Alphaproteobacteria bacterium]|nr:MFS transporter [Alphaproteobacteria bacterium]